MVSDDRSAHDEHSVNSADLIDGLLRASQIVRVRFNEWLGRFEMNDGRHAVLTTLARAEASGCSQAQLAERNWSILNQTSAR